MGSLPRRAVRAAWVPVLCRQAGVMLACLVFGSAAVPGAETAASAGLELRWLGDTPAPGRAVVEVTGLSAAALVIVSAGLELATRALELPFALDATGIAILSITVYDVAMALRTPSAA